MFGQVGLLRRQHKLMDFYRHIRPKITYYALFKQIRKYEEAGGVLTEYKPKRTNLKVSDEVFKYISDPSTLKKWVGKSLKTRCVLIEKEFNVKITKQTLKTYYDKANIRRVNPLYRYSRPVTDEEQQKEQLQFVHILMKYQMDEAYELFYFDVSVFSH